MTSDDYASASQGHVVRGTTRLSRAIVGLTVMIGVLLAVASPAAAHVELLATSPADAATMTSPVEEVTLTFSGAIGAGGSTVTVTGPDGQNHSTGQLSVLDFVVHQPVTTMPSGAYRVAWTVIAGDGHPMTGEFTFQLALPPEVEPTPTPTATPQANEPSDPTTAVNADLASDRSGSGPAWWVLAVIAAAVVIVISVLLVRRTNQGRR